MRIVIAGGHGKIALQLESLLAARGDQVVGIIRNPAHADEVAATGAQTVVLDLETATAGEVATHLDGADAVVFAAGAGPGSGAPRKQTVDRDAAILLADAAETAGVRRYVMVSAMAADAAAPEDPDNPVFSAYLRAKGAADDDIRSRAALDWTIVRPGLLTDDAGSGLVTIAATTGPGAVARADVAAVLLAVLDDPGTTGSTFELISGDSPVDAAVGAVVG